MIIGCLCSSRAAFVKSSLLGIFGMQEGGPVTLVTALLERYERIVYVVESLVLEICVRIITEKDFTIELRALAKDEHVRALIIRGNRDQGYAV